VAEAENRAPRFMYKDSAVWGSSSPPTPPLLRCLARRFYNTACLRWRTVLSVEQRAIAVASRVLTFLSHDANTDRLGSETPSSDSPGRRRAVSKTFSALAKQTHTPISSFIQQCFRKHSLSPPSVCDYLELHAVRECARVIEILFWPLLLILVRFDFYRRSNFSSAAASARFLI